MPRFLIHQLVRLCTADAHAPAKRAKCAEHGTFQYPILFDSALEARSAQLGFATFKLGTEKIFTLCAASLDAELIL